MNLETRFLSVLEDFFLVEPSCDSLAAALTAAICFILYGVRFEEVSGDVPVTKQELNLSSVLDVRVWSRIGSQSDYEMGADPNTVFGGKYSGYIKSKKPEIEGFAGYAQMIPAVSFRGKRVRFSAAFKSEGVERSAGLADVPVKRW